MSRHPMLGQGKAYQLLYDVRNRNKPPTTVSCQKLPKAHRLRRLSRMPEHLDNTDLLSLLTQAKIASQAGKCVRGK